MIFGAKSVQPSRAHFGLAFGRNQNDGCDRGGRINWRARNGAKSNAIRS
jgi:hypothetical protein